jgi:hypothetical protein
VYSLAQVLWPLPNRCCRFSRQIGSGDWHRALARALIAIMAYAPSRRRGAKPGRPKSRREPTPDRCRGLELLAGRTLSWAGRLFPVVPLIVAATAYAAEPLPKKFVGSWCLDSEEHQAAIYKKRPQPGDFCQFAEDRLVVRANGFETAESRCALIEVTPVKTLKYETFRAIFGCRSNKDQLDHWVFDAWMWTTDDVLGIQDTPDKNPDP